MASSPMARAKAAASSAQPGRNSSLSVLANIASSSLFLATAFAPGGLQAGDSFEGETKKEMFDQLPPYTYPKSVYVTPSMDFSEIEKLVELNRFDFPLAVKPNVGMMGFMFRKIDSLEKPGSRVGGSSCGSEQVKMVVDRTAHKKVDEIFNI